jgi:hypothetical protein
VLPTPYALNRTRANPAATRLRHQQARDTAESLAGETGGHAFLRGQNGARVAERIRRDFSCLYLLSFDPSDFKEDTPLRILVDTSRKGVKVTSRGQLILRSESAETVSRLLSAFVTADSNSQDVDFDVQAVLVPTGFADGSYTALLQIRAPALPVQVSTWDLGASVVGGDSLHSETSGRVAVTRPGVPVVFERELTFRPGEYEIVTVAHETTTGLVSSHLSHTDWPDPRSTPVTLGPIALLQPLTGAFLRAETRRTSGSSARGPLEPVRTDRDTALVGLVCHGKRQQGAITVSRRLVGETSVDFPSLDVRLGDERCAQIRDLVPAGAMGAGHYRYEVRARKGDHVLAEREHEFTAWSPDS